MLRSSFSNLFTSAKKIYKYLSLFLLLFSNLILTSCEDGCVEAYEFDVESSYVESRPTKERVYGIYNDLDGGQKVDWHETGLRSNGDQFLFSIDGAWVPLLGNASNDTVLESLPICGFCAKRDSVNHKDNNCICYKDQIPSPEKGIDDLPLNVDCSEIANQNDPAKCTCTKDPQFGLATDYGIFHFPLNIYEKNGQRKLSDKQTQCKYSKGMGLYVGLFGSDGLEMPKRVYHLYSPIEICPVVKDSQGKCKDASGRDVTSYSFESANSRIFMKDDGDGNSGINPNNANDTYRNPGEMLKFVIYDNYYNDNYGGYNVRILKGVGKNGEEGLLEFIVSLFEDLVMGKVNNSTGEREGGIIEYMYKSITQDGQFILIIQVCLAIYITFFGLSYLMGVIDLSKKEVMLRILKISLVVFFTSKESWYFYNKIVVSLFKDSMDYVIATIMDLTESNLDPSDMIKVAQMGRAADISNATRFSYVDLIIKKLMSASTAKKIFGLFATQGLGFLYIPIIYSLIFFFIYSMLSIASIYIINLIKIIFILSLGPIFMIFLLFPKTRVDKNWIAFLGARSLEMVIMFTVLYFFLNVLDRKFSDLLFYRACTEKWSIVIMSGKILKSYVDRSVGDWFLSFTSIAALIFFTRLAVDQTANVAGRLINIGGIDNWKAGDGTGKGQKGYNLGVSIFSNISNLAKGAASEIGGTAASWGARGAISGLSVAANSITGFFGFKNVPGGIRGLVRNSTIDSAIEKARSQSGGRTGDDLQKFIRANVLNDLRKQAADSPTKMALLGLDEKDVLKRLDQKLIKEPLKNFIEEKAKHLRSMPNAPIGKAMRDSIAKEAKEWAKSNYGNSDIGTISNYLDKSKAVKGLIDKSSEFSSSEAALAFSGSKERQDEYLRHLLNKEMVDRPLLGDSEYKNRAENFHYKLDELQKEKELGFFADRGMGMTLSDKKAREMDGNRKKNLIEQISKLGRDQRSEYLRNQLFKAVEKDFKHKSLNSKDVGLKLLREETNKFEELQKSNGNYRDLIESAARLSFLEKEVKDNSEYKEKYSDELSRLKEVEDKKYDELLSSRIKTLSDKIDGELEVVEAKNQKNEEFIARIDGAISAFDQNTIEKNKENYDTLIRENNIGIGGEAYGKDLQIGANNVGIAGANVGLGAAEEIDGARKQLVAAQTASLNMEKNYYTSAKKLAHFNLKIKQFELSKIEDQKSKEAMQLANEISSIEGELKDHDIRIGAIDGKIDSVVKAVPSS